ncbi:hypothetical protein QTQ03_03390 [Micromonospora sp. WMMA1363]|uniref:hypothetical protein n=1 Tax=Micromonospora sp. WMMA1363 TaxID=3053985 RepID=UPI00259C820F|nr:hypothetical protein [Micromonospora sp. WMMA1363]MDM4718684.1 hypothetical protein [Micromonospora sp. WMMA1363]
MSMVVVSTGNRADVAHPATYAAGVPYAEFARLRREEPVSWVPEAALWRRSGEGRMLSQGPGFWAVTTHDGVVSASRQPEVFSSGRQGAFLADPRTTADLEQARQLLVNMDAPQHARVRKLVTAVFTPGRSGRSARASPRTPGPWSSGRSGKRSATWSPTSRPSCR